MDIRKESIKRGFPFHGALVVNVESVGYVRMVDIFSAEERKTLLGN